MEVPGLNLIFLLGPCSNPVRWEGWMRDLVEARMLQPFRVAEPGVDEKTISAPSRKARGTTTHPQSSVNKSPDYPKPPQSLLFRLWRII